MSKIIVSNTVDKFKKEINQNVIDYLNSVMLQVNADATRDAPADTGTLSKSITINPMKPSNLIVTVGSELNYAGFVEYGRSPGKMPPPMEMIEWVKKNLGVSDEEAKGVAFAVAKKIATKGIKPKPFLVPNFLKHTKNVAKTIKKLIEKG